MNHSFALSISIILSLGTLSLPCRGQLSVGMTDSVHIINDVAVVGERTHFLTPSQELSGAALQSLSSTSIADALKYFSGVQIKDYGGLGGLKTVNVRSLGSQHVGVYLDGIRITNAQNGQVDLGRYSLQNMEAVALYNANRSERLQSATEYASAATIYMRTRRPDSTALRLEYGNGSFGLNKAKAYFSYKSLFFVDAEWQHTRGDYPFRFLSEQEDTVGRRANSDITFIRTEAAAFFRDFSAHIYYYSSRRGLPGPVVRRLSEQWASTDRQWDKNFFVQSSYRHSWRNIAVKANAKYSLDRLHYLQDPSTNAATMRCDNHYTQQSIYASAAAAWNTQWLSVTASTDLTWNDLRSDVYRFSYVWRMDSKTVLSAIAAYKGFEANAALLYTHISDHSRNAAPTLSRLTPMFMASWHHDAWTIRAFHKRIFRAPTLNDLYYTLVGSTSLKPEYASQWDIGTDFRAHGLHFAVDFYHNRITDKIVAIPMKCQFRWSMVNFGLVKSLGMSATAGFDHRWGRLALSANANYTCQRDLDFTSPSDPEYRNYLPYSPLHSASAIVSIDYDGWQLGASWLYTGNRFALISNNRDDMLGAWQTLDLKLNKSLALRRCTLNFTIECNNAMNSRHEVVKRYPMPGRNWKFTVAWTGFPAKKK